MKAKIRSKHILLLFVGIIILLLGGIFLAAQQEKEGSITAEAASVYWEIPDFCPECGAENSDINMTRTDFTRVGDGCTFTYEHKIRSGIYCTGTVTIHTGVSVAAKNPTCTSSGNTAGAKCGICGIPDPKNPVRTIAALGHNYVAEWSGSDYQSATVRFKCSRCSSKLPDEATITERTVKEATCTEQGQRIYTATLEYRGETYIDFKNESLPALGHDIENHAGKEPTCTAVGWNAYETCSRCDYTTYQEIAATGHTPGAAATCTTPQTCTECGTTLTEATGHTWDSGEVISKAGCIYDGKIKYTCTECGETKTEDIPALGHGWGETKPGQAPTCTSAGYTSYKTCIRCGYTTRETIPALGHSYGSYTQTKAPTCTEDGTETAKCIRCTSQKTRNIDALGHDLEYHAGKEPTCTSVGWNAYETCNRAGCAYTTYREIAATGHTPGAAATCTTSQTCTVCGATLVEALGHKTVSHLGQDPTCTAEGWKPYETCENCDYTTYEIILALGHSFTNYVSDNNATCTEDGTETAKCDRCEVTDTRTDEGSALGHDWAEEWMTDGTSHWHECSRCDEINDKANHSGGTATCIALAKCEICGAEYGDLAEHVYVENAEEQYLVSAATCTAKATYYKSCSVCGEAGEEVFEYGEPLGHEYGEPEWTWEGYTSATATFTCTRGCGDKQTATASGSSITNVVTTPAECETEGLRTYTAKVMFGGEEYVTTTTETIPALEHVEDEAVRENEVPASCTAAGSYDEVIYCSVCGEELSREEKVIDALGHSFTSYISDNNATCTENGTETAKCDRCEVTDTRTDEGSALGHDLEHHEAKPATCTQNGWNAYETCNRAGCAYTTYREISATGHTPSAAATCTTPQTCTVCGATLVEALGHSFVDGYCTTCGVSDEEALENDREDAKTDLDDVAQDVKDEIDASDLPDDVKEDLKDKVDEIINGAKDEVDGSTDFDDVNQAVEDARQEIEDAILNTEKDDAKSDLDEIVQNAKDEIDASELPEDVKEDLKDKVDEIVNDAKTEIDSETTKEEVEAAVEDARQEIEDSILNTEKDDAKSDLDEIVQNAKDEIDASDLSDEEKNELKGKLDEVLSSAKEEIGNATSKEEVDAIVNDVRKDIEDLLNGSSGDEISEEKEVAVSDLENTVQNAKDEIGASDLSDEEKDELKGKLDEVLSSAKEEIGIAATTEEIEEVLTSAKEEIDALTEKLTEGQPDASPLWPWLIAAVVISAALAAIFAWRHVRSVRGKGETIGVRSVVTIAVATILIFVLVIGIALLIFAMI